MENLYLDFNVISYLRRGQQPALTRAFNHAAKSQLVVFSPAHLEDVAASAIRDAAPPAIIKAEIDFLAKIAGRNGLRPITHDRVVLYDESPHDCYVRVVAQYDKNDVAEEIDASVIADAHESPAGAPREMNNIPHTEILSHIIYRELIVRTLFLQGLIARNEQESALSWQFDDLKDRFKILQAYINLAANFLEKIGYHREDRDKSRARLHDVSHIIYAAYCGTFVTADKKLAKKAMAIYSLLGIRTLVLLDKEFAAKLPLDVSNSADG